MTNKEQLRMDSRAVRSMLQVYFIMGSVNCAGRPPEEVLKAAVSGGITVFQYREKGPGALTGSAAYELGLRLRDICREAGIPFIVNDDVQLAAALQADGIHVGQEDAPASTLRGLLGGGAIIGVSAKTIGQAEQAVLDGADYLGIGPVYPTASKEDAGKVQGTSVIRNLRELGIDIPVVGIGGITPDNAPPVLAAGADGVSVISAISGAAQPREAAAAFSRMYT